MENYNEFNWGKFNYKFLGPLVLAHDQKIVRRNIAAVLDERSLLITKGPVGLNHNETLQPP